MALDRYLKDEQGFRKYVELMETTPTAKRQTLMGAARAENAAFVAEAEKHILTFDRITKLPPLELTEVLGDKTLKPRTLAFALLSVDDPALREKLLAHVPRSLLPVVSQEMKDAPLLSPQDVGGSRLQMIKAARELERNGRLESLKIPHFGVGHFARAAA